MKAIFSLSPPTFANRPRCGVGYANLPGSLNVHYWVFIAAPPSREGIAEKTAFDVAICNFPRIL